jgi:cytochrome c biogenesis protein CcmG/thiol:disulfide interchange protein DsbE
MSEGKRRGSWLAALPPMLFLALAGVFLLGLGRDDPQALPTALAGRDAPALALDPAPVAMAPPLTDALLRAPGPKLVNFWASWCPPCRAEHPMLSALAQGGLPIHGINFKDDPANAARFLTMLGDPFASQGSDPRGRNAIEWGVSGVPETFLLDGEGRIVLRIQGPITRQVLDRQLRPALDALEGPSTNGHRE